jgi:hypothetical protein
MNRERIDMATPYLREALRFIGVSDVRFVPIGPTTGPTEPIRIAVCLKSLHVFDAGYVRLVAAK